jgi:hypothetical protein
MKLYTALRFRGRPDLHMTLHHYGNIASQEAVVEQIEEIVKFTKPRSFQLVLDRQITVGYTTLMTALGPSGELPSWVQYFTNKGWLPHVVTSEPSLILEVEAVVLMCKDKEIKRWEEP